MHLEPRYHYKDLRVNLVPKGPLAGAIVVQFRSPKGTWNILAKVGYFNLAMGAPKIYFSSQLLAF